MNRVMLSGNIGEAPTVRQTSGGAVAKLRVATNEQRKRGDRWEDHTEWHTVVVFGKRAEHCGDRLVKGSQVIVEGRLQTQKWTDQAGVDRWTTEVIAERIEWGARVKASPSSRPPGPDDGDPGGSDGGGADGGGGDDGVPF